MSLYATIDDQPAGDVATNAGWADFVNWVLSMEGPEELRQLAEHGWADDGEQLAADLEAAIESGEPTPDQRSIAEGLKAIAEKMGDDAVLTVSDGAGVGLPQESLQESYP